MAIYNVIYAILDTLSTIVDKIPAMYYMTLTLRIRKDENEDDRSHTARELLLYLKPVSVVVF